jgi:hypothetical protein
MLLWAEDRVYFCRFFKTVQSDVGLRCQCFRSADDDDEQATAECQTVRIWRTVLEGMIGGVRSV